jgi:hypothetical protein
VLAKVCQEGVGTLGVTVLYGDQCTLVEPSKTPTNSMIESLPGDILTTFGGPYHLPPLLVATPARSNPIAKIANNYNRKKPQKIDVHEALEP